MSAAEPILETPAPTTPSSTPAPAAPPAPGLKFAPTPGAPAPAAAPPAPIQLQPWMGELDADHAAYVQGKGWLKEGKSFADVVKAHRAAEAFIGRPADQVIAKPDWSKAESVAEYRVAIGAPAEPTGYESPELGLPEGLIDPPRIAQVSHALGLSQEQHAAFVGETAKFFQEAFAQHAEEVSLRNSAELVAMQKEYGANWPALEQSVQNAITGLEITAEDFEAARIMLGERKVRQSLAKLSLAMKEHTRPSEGSPGFQIKSAEAAKAEIKALYLDKQFMADLEAGGRKEADAKQRWNDLHALAASGG